MDKTLEEVEETIHNQCRLGHVEKVMNMIESGMDPNVLDDDERTPLHWAASSKNPEVLHFLLSLPSIKINAKDDFGTTPLMCAVSSGHYENVKLLYDAHADVNAEDDNGETVIHMTKRNTDILKLFVKDIKDINKKNEYGITALMKAASLNCVDSVTVLLDNGADMSLQDHEGNTAGHYAAFDNSRDAYVLMLHRGYNEEIRNKENKVALDYV